MATRILAAWCVLEHLRSITKYTEVAIGTFSARIRASQLSTLTRGTLPKASTSMYRRTTRSM